MINIKMAMEFGDRESIFLEKLAFWSKFNRTKPYCQHEGRSWMYHSYTEFIRDWFPFWSLQRLRTTVSSLVKKGAILQRSGTHDDARRNGNCGLWYAIVDQERVIEAFHPGSYHCNNVPKSADPLLKSTDLEGKGMLKSTDLGNDTYNIILNNYINNIKRMSISDEIADPSHFLENVEKKIGLSNKWPYEVQKQFGKQVMGYFEISDSIDNAEEIFERFQKTVEQQSDRIKAICAAAYLNSKYGKKTRFLPESFVNIEARLKSGYTYSDCIAIIDSKAQEWGADEETKEKMWKHLNLETLFSKTKAAKYLTEIGEEEGGI